MGVPNEQLRRIAEIMKTVSLAVIILGLLVSLAFLIAGVVCSVPWNTGCVVLFGFGIAYAGVCALAHAKPNEAAVEWIGK